MNYFSMEVQELLDAFVDIVVNELPHTLPPIRSISHHVDLILGEFFLNKATYRLSPQENEEVKEQVQELLEKGLIRERLSLCVVPTILSQKKDGGSRICTYSRAINNITIMYRFLCWLWSLIIFLIQRFFFSRVYTSMWGSAEGGYTLCGGLGENPLKEKFPCKCIF
jgi:hypothetical protein